MEAKQTNMKHVVLDTNMLMAVGQYRIDVLGELQRICDFLYDVNVVEGTVDELKWIAKRNDLAGRAARLGLDLVKKLGFGVISEHKEKIVDDALVELSKEGYVVVTRDAELKKRLARPYITLRKEKYLMFG